MIHLGGAPFQKLSEPNNWKRLVKEMQVRSMTEAGIGFLSR